MYEFVGKLIGMSARFNMTLPFQFAPMVWRRLTGCQLEEVSDCRGSPKTQLMLRSHIVIVMPCTV